MLHAHFIYTRGACFMYAHEGRQEMNSLLHEKDCSAHSTTKSSAGHAQQRYTWVDRVSHMVATAGSIAKLPSKNVPKMLNEPQMSNMMLMALLRNHNENTQNIDKIKSNAKITNQATDLSGSPALVWGPRWTSHGKHRPVAAMSHRVDVTTPRFPFIVSLDISTA